MKRASAGVSVHAARLVSDHTTIFEFNNPAAHLVNYLSVVG
jgi:hypothetical protein